MEAFVRVVDAGGFSAAARSWRVSKAAVSKYVAALEAHLGVELLRRTTRAVVPTDAGRSYYRSCVDLLGELEQIEASLRDDHAQPRGRLRVTAPPGFMAVHGELITSGLVARYPQLQVDLQLTHRMVDLIEEQIDVAIRITVPRDSSLVARRIAAAPIVAVAAPSYLARAGRPRKPADLRDHDCLVDTNFRDGARWSFRRGGRRELVEVDGPFRVNSPTVVRDLAVAGHGVALVPELVARAQLDDGRLVPVLVDMPDYDWGIYALYPRRRYLSGRARALIDHLVDELGGPARGGGPA
jgi:DNA-binding transcriptional LysR family regulator